MRATEVAAIIAPSIGPAVVTVFGQAIPVLSLALSVAGLLLARTIAPPPLRRLTRWQHFSLTALLLLLLFLIVTGAFTDEPLSYGQATLCGIGLGFSGLVAIEMFASRWLAAVRVFMQGKDTDP